MSDDVSAALLSPQEHMEWSVQYARRAESNDPRNQSAQVEANLALTHTLIARTIFQMQEAGRNPFRGYDR